jgi:circadian clock protein KaiC
MPGLHTFRITDNGLQIFPRIPEQTRTRRLQKRERLSTGVPGLDEMIGGGVIAGDAVMLTGPAGSGKSTVATQFMVAGVTKGETGVIAVFEEYPEEYLARANARNPDIGKMLDAGKLELIYLRPLDLSVDEALAAILEAVERLKAKRVVIDSLSGFEVALAPTFREDFRESLYRLVGTLTATGVTVFMTAEVSEAFSEARFTTEKVSFITDEIIVQRYVEMKGELRRVMAVIKMRGSEHTHEFRTYDVTAKGVVVDGSLTEYDGIITGVPTLRAKPIGAKRSR